MVLYRARIHLEGPIASTLASGMIFGQLCWALRESKGEAALLAWLSAPEALWGISDAFPADCLPRPLLTPRAGAAADTVEGAAEHKKLGKMPFIARAAFLRDRGDLGARRLGDKDLHKPVDGTRRTARNSIDRHTGRARDEGGLFFREEFWPLENAADRDLYVEAPAADRERVHELLAHMGESGFGKAASLGRGRFALVDLAEDAELANLADANRYLSLSRGTRTDNMADMLFRVEPHFGKAGPQLTLGEGASPFKRPILLSRPGATFARAGEGRFGQWLTCVHPTRPEIGHNAFHLAIPFREADDA